MCAVVCAKGSDGHFCSSSFLKHLLSFPAPLGPLATWALPCWAHRKSAKRALLSSSWELAGHFLVLFNYYCLLNLNSTYGWELGHFSKTPF